MDKIRKAELEKNREETIRKIAILDIDIKILEAIDPKKVIGRKKLTEQSSREVTAGDQLKDIKEQKEGNERRLKAIEELLNGN